MSDIKNLIVPFLLGGSVIASVKYIASHSSNPGLAAVAGGLPTGLITIYFLTQDKTIPYSHNYFYVTLILATSILLFYLLRIHTSWDKNIVLLVALLTWATLVTIHFLTSKPEK